LVETEYLLEVVSELGFTNKKEGHRLEEIRKEIGIMLNAFISSVRNKL